MSYYPATGRTLAMIHSWLAGYAKTDTKRASLPSVPPGDGPGNRYEPPGGRG